MDTYIIMNGNFKLKVTGDLILKWVDSENGINPPLKCRYNNFVIILSKKCLDKQQTYHLIFK